MILVNLIEIVGRERLIFWRRLGGFARSFGFGVVDKSPVGHIE
jgi:hypothetical protein